jgi:serine protease Do
VPDSGAAKAGLRQGDFIVSVAGKAVTNANDLRNIVAGLPTDKPAQVEFYRDGKKQSVKVEVQHQPTAAVAGAPGKATAGDIGIEVENVTAESVRPYGYRKTPRGVIITRIEPGSAADEQGLREGMVINEIQDRAVDNVDQFRSAIAQAKGGVRLRVTTPEGGAQYFFLPLGK